jgi:predicted hydrocarbon binding protein
MDRAPILEPLRTRSIFLAARDRVAARDLFFLCINRRKFMPARREVPSSQIAPIQRELAESEDRLGVQRDSGERRIVQTTPIFLDALASAHDKHGEAGSAFLDAWGFAWGRRAAVDLETEVLESFDKLLRELPMVTVTEVVAQYVRRQGFGQLTVDFAPSKLGVFLLRLERSAFAEAVPPGSKRPRCTVFSAFFRAVLGHLAHRPLIVRESECLALGAPCCTFVVAAETRGPTIDAAIAAARDAPLAEAEKTAAVLRRLRD